MSVCTSKVNVVSERSYGAGQAFEMTRIVKVGDHTLRIVAHRGSSIGYTKGYVKRFDGAEWKQIEFANGYDLLGEFDGNAPSYVLWDSPTRHEECVEWLVATCDRVLERALTWLP